jgi:hypothetical protein
VREKYFGIYFIQVHNVVINLLFIFTGSMIILKRFYLKNAWWEARMRGKTEKGGEAVMRNLKFERRFLSLMVRYVRQSSGRNDLC